MYGSEQISAGSAGESPTSSLALAAAHLGGGLRPNATHGGGAKEQWSRFLRWCREKELILPQDYPAPQIADTSEHEVRFNPTTGRWYKYTLPGQSGFTVDWDESDIPLMRSATLAEYLHRNLAQNELFQDDIKFHGVWHDDIGGGWRVVTSQPDVSGEPAERSEILQGMGGFGFYPVPGLALNHAPVFQRGDILVWDAHAGNVVRTSSGVIVPIDLIITQRLA